MRLCSLSRHVALTRLRISWAGWNPDKHKLLHPQNLSLQGARPGSPPAWLRRGRHPHQRGLQPTALWRKVMKKSGHSDGAQEDGQQYPAQMSIGTPICLK